MKTEEYTFLSNVEAEHWFYKGKRLIVLGWLDRLNAVSPQSLLVDIGAGTGAFVDHMSRFCRTLGVENSSPGLSIAARTGVADRIIGGSSYSIPLKDNCADIVTCLDVLEHLQDDRRAVEEIIRVTKPGGVILVSVPACAWAMSDWDVSLGHYRRYHAGQMRALFTHAEVEIVHLNYINSLFFLPIVIYRKYFARGMGGNRLEDKIPPPWLNRFLLNSFVWPAVKGLPMPFGLSLFAVAKKRNSSGRQQ